MYYVKTWADNSGYANHRVICLVVIGSSFDSEQVFQVSNELIPETTIHTFDINALLTMIAINKLSEMTGNGHNFFSLM
jgi:hypothetical protein